MKSTKSVRAVLLALVSCAAVPACVFTAAPAAAQSVTVVKDAKTSCPDLFKFDEVTRKCVVVDAAEVAALKEAACKGPGLAWAGDPPKCLLNVGQPPAPSCTGGALPLSFDTSLGQCVVKADAVQRSALTDYLGDCYRIRGLPKDSKLALKNDSVYQVRAQRKEGEDDKRLTLAPATGDGTLGCKPKKGAELIDLKASELQAIGADRAGWAFGVLALPYKFHTDDRSFGSSTSIGPYVGRRWGTPGSAYTFALAATIGSVQGEVRDAQNNITDTPDLQAFSLALGWSYDIAKSPEARPFKVGFFVGADWVGSSNVVKYKHNRKPWVALQVGFDFLD